MHPFVQKNNLKPGDVLIVPKSNFEIIGHHVIYLGQDVHYRDLFCENNNIFGVRLIDANQFCAINKKVWEIKRFSGNNYERQVAVKRALDNLGQPYSLINFNCEHFANYVQTGKASSRQVKVGLGLGLGLLALLLIGIRVSK